MTICKTSNNVLYYENPALKPIIDSSLLLWLTSDNGTPTTWNDRSGNIRDASCVNTLRNPPYPSGMFGYALEFDGSTSYGTVNNIGINGALSLSATIGLWFKTNNPQVSSFGKQLLSIPSTTASNNGWDISITPAGTGIITHMRTGLNTYATVTSNFSFSDGNWHNAVSTYDGINLSLYIDGIFINSVLWAGGIPVTTNILNIGRFSGSITTNYSNCIIAEIYAYNRSLSASEVQYNHANNFLIYI